MDPLHDATDYHLTFHIIRTEQFDLCISMDVVRLQNSNQV